MATPSDDIVDPILRLLAVEEMREKPMGEALGIHLRRTGISSPNESFAGELPDGPLEKVEFRVNKETDGAIVTLTVRDGEPALYQGQLDFSRLGQKPTALDFNPHIPPEGVADVIYGPVEKRTFLRFTAKTKRFLGVTIQWGASH
jgi:hypothetical protein